MPAHWMSVTPVGMGRPKTSSNALSGDKVPQSTKKGGGQVTCVRSHAIPATGRKRNSPNNAHAIRFVIVFFRIEAPPPSLKRQVPHPHLSTHSPGGDMPAVGAPGNRFVHPPTVS